MKILLSAFACEPNRGSEPGVGWHWATGLAALGHDVHVLTHPRGRDAIERDQMTVRSDVKLRFHYVDVPLLKPAPGRYRFGNPTAEFLLFCPAWQWLAYKRAKALHAVENFDVAHHITYGSVRQPSFMGKLGIPFILGPIGGGERAPFRLRVGYSLLGWAWDVARDIQNVAIRYAPLMRFTFRTATTIYVKTTESARVIPPKHRDKVKVGWEIGLKDDAILPISHAHHARAADRPTNRPKNGGLKVLYVGRLLHAKGADFAIRGFHDARLRGAQLELTVVGRGPDARKLRTLSKNLSVDSCITWVDHLPQKELFGLYRSHDIFLFPSLHDSSGNVILEAMGNGLPIVCLDLGGPGKLVTPESGIVVSTKDASRDRVVSRLGRALTTLQNDDLRSNLADGALRAAAGLTWEAAILNVYNFVPKLTDARTGSLKRFQERRSPLL